MKQMMLIMPVISGIMWGSAGVFVRTLDEFGFNNITMITIRVLLAALVMLIGILIADKKILKIKIKDIWLFAVCGLIGMIGLNLSYNEAISRVTLSLAAVLLSMSPIFVMILASVILKEKVTLRKVGCTALAVLGCVLVSGILESGNGGSLSAIGVFAGLAAAFFYALYSIFSKVAMKKGYNVFTVTFYSLLIGAIVLSPFADWSIIAKFVSEAPAGNGVFLLLNALCNSVLPYVLYTLSLSYVDTGKVSILASGGEPSAAMVFGILFFAEIPTALSLIGLAVTIAALWLLCRPAKAASEKKAVKETV